MDKMHTSYNVRNKKFIWNLALLIFASILVLSGTFFRIRPSGELPTLDWLVLARLIACSLGFVVGVILILKSQARFGFGSLALSLFVAATGISAINSPYPTIVFGYFILLLGASALVLGLVQSAPDVKRLEQIEWVWFFTISICVIKDAFTSLIFPDPEEVTGIVRLGMGITHANQISLMAGLVFWLSFKQAKASIILWLLRIAMLMVILGAISRVGILAFLFGGFMYGLLRGKNFTSKAILTLTCLSGLVFFLLLTSLSPRWQDKVTLYIKRGQTQAEISAFTSRKDIWRQAIRQIPEAPLFGHGFGITRFTIKPVTWQFQEESCHNDVLEALFSIGFLGFSALLLLYIYNLKWIIFFSRLKRIFSSDLALHASAIVVMFLVVNIFEARISEKLLPFQPLFFYYLLILDREKHFAIMGRENESQVTL